MSVIPTIAIIVALSMAVITFVEEDYVTAIWAFNTALWAGLYLTK